MYINHNFVICVSKFDFFFFYKLTTTKNRSPLVYFKFIFREVLLFITEVIELMMFQEIPNMDKDIQLSLTSPVTVVISVP